MEFEEFKETVKLDLSNDQLSFIYKKTQKENLAVVMEEIDKRFRIYLVLNKANKDIIDCLFPRTYRNNIKLHIFDKTQIVSGGYEDWKTERLKRELINLD